MAHCKKTVIAFMGLVTLALGGCRDDTEVLAFDGVYQSEKSGSGYSGYWSYLRFYEDGLVVSMSSADTPEVVKGWLSKSSRSASCGRYKVDGKKLTFNVINENGIVDYEGKISGENLSLDFFSHINENRISDRAYSFVAVDLPSAGEALSVHCEKALVE